MRKYKHSTKVRNNGYGTRAEYLAECVVCSAKVMVGYNYPLAKNVDNIIKLNQWSTVFQKTEYIFCSLTHKEAFELAPKGYLP